MSDEEDPIGMYDPNAIIAERTLTRCDTGADVSVRVFKPVPDPEGQDWACGYEIVGLDQTIRSRSMGIDSIQALMLTFQAIRHELNRSAVPVALEVDASGYTGFERFHHDPDMEALFEHLMEAELIRQNTIFELLDGGAHREPATTELLDHVRKAEAIRQRILRRILERAAKR